MAEITATTDTTQIQNPFSDQAAIRDDRLAMVDSTLTVGRTATLTFGTDAVIILDEGLRGHARFHCCGLWPQKATNTRSIPYFNVLWADIVKGDLTIHYAQPKSNSPKASLRVAYMNYRIEDSTSAQERAAKWVDRLLERAYGQAQRRKRIKVLLNPFGGAGKAVKLYTTHIEPIFAAARCEVDVETTTHAGHAVDIAERLDINAFDVLASASGDGLPHECINGLAKQPNAAEALRKIAITQLPCGTGNAMSWNFNGTGECSLAALAIVKGVRSPFDLASVTQGDRRTLSFLSQSLGIVAETDLGTEHVRWMGDARFTYGFLVRLLDKMVYPCDIAVKTEIEDKEEIKRHFARQMAHLKSAQVPVPRDEPLGAPDTSPNRGLPPLKWGTVNDPLPTDAGWSPLMPYDNLGNFYCGNMALMAADATFFPASLPSDGLLDLVTIDGDIGRLKAVDLLLSVPKGTFFDKDCVRIRKVTAVRVIPRFGPLAPVSSVAPPQSPVGKALARFVKSRQPSQAARGAGYFSVDGERMPFEPFQVEVHKGLCTVLSRHVGVYETHGPPGWEAVDVSGEAD